MSSINRRRSVTVDIDGVKVGGENPIAVQSMTNTDTVDVEATALQVEQLARAGSELVRITVNTRQAAEAVPHIADHLAERGIIVPIIGDFHYNGHILLKEYPACARADAGGLESRPPLRARRGARLEAPSAVRLQIQSGRSARA